MQKITLRDKRIVKREQDRQRMLRIFFPEFNGTWADYLKIIDSEPIIIYHNPDDFLADFLTGDND